MKNMNDLLRRSDSMGSNGEKLKLMLRHDPEHKFDPMHKSIFSKLKKNSLEEIRLRCFYLTRPKSSKTEFLWNEDKEMTQIKRWWARKVQKLLASQEK